MKSWLQNKRQFKKNSRKSKEVKNVKNEFVKARKMTESEIKKWVTFYESSRRKTPNAFILFKNINGLNPTRAQTVYEKLSADIKFDYERCAEIIKISTYDPETASKIIDSQTYFYNYNSKFFELTLANVEKPPRSTKKMPHVELTQDAREPYPGHVNNDISIVSHNIFNNHGNNIKDQSQLPYQYSVDMPPVAPNIFFPSNDGNITEGKRSSSQLLKFF